MEKTVFSEFVIACRRAAPDEPLAGLWVNGCDRRNEPRSFGGGDDDRLAAFHDMATTELVVRVNADNFTMMTF